MSSSSGTETKQVPPLAEQPAAPRGGRPPGYAKRVAGYLPIAVAVLAVVYWLNGDVSYQYTSVRAVTTAIAALGFYLVYQVGGVTLAQAGLMAIGAYTSGLLALKLGVTPFLGMLVGIVASLVVGLLVGMLITRARSEFHFILVTFAFSEVVRLFLQRWVYGADGVPDIPAPTIFGFAFDTAARYYWLALGALALAVVAVWWVMSSGLGRTLHTVRDGEGHLAPSFGVRANSYKVLVFGIASALAGLAGGLQAHFSNFVAPEQFNLHFSVLVLASAVLGGISSVAGPVIGAFSLAFLDEALGDHPGMNIVIYGAVLVAVMLVMPKGLIGAMRSANQYVRARLTRSRDRGADS